MTKENTEKPFLQLRKVFNEILLRDIILFGILFLFTLAQSWDNIFLFLFPIITFAYSLFFRILSTNKWRILSENCPIVYSPIGLEKKHANRFVFSSLIQLILLFWIGAESLYHPQLVDDYNIYFNIIFFFFYSFGFYWIMIDIWKFSRFDLIFKNVDYQDKTYKPESEIKRIINFLKLKEFKKISLVNLFVFLTLNLSNILLSVFIQNNIITGIPFQLPGTGLESSGPIEITLTSLIIIIVSPLLMSFFLIIIYRDINNFSIENLNKALIDLPDNLKNQILDNLKNLNTKFLKIISME